MDARQQVREGELDPAVSGGGVYRRVGGGSFAATFPITALLYSVSARLSAKYTVSHAYFALTETSVNAGGAVDAGGSADSCRGSSRDF